VEKEGTDHSMKSAFISFPD